jgi:predicted ABC-class ATPase
VEQRSQPHPTRGEARESDDLFSLLQRLDGQPFGRYRQLMGRHRVGEFDVRIDRVQPDPFAGAARIRLSLDRGASGLPRYVTGSRPRRIGVEDYVARRTARTLRQQPGGERPPAPGSGAVFLQPFGPEVIERSACRVLSDRIELRLFVHLPAARRRIRGKRALELFEGTLVRLATSNLLFSAGRIEKARAAADNAEDHAAMQDELRRRGLVAFVGDASLLARAAGDDPRPRSDGREVRFDSPDALRVTLDLPHRGRLTGMGIPGGVTVIVGGAFHGKSTLLQAIARGIDPHHPGDGREAVATVAQAVVVHAEDGRPVRGVDISSFVGELPSGALAAEFSTEKASGSTSQASSIVEALEIGARLLILDEDRCATNFMVRDGRMQRLVPRPAEPIVPFLDRVRELYDRLGVSTILVTGGTGDYLEVADTVVRMEGYRPHDVTDRAREVVASTRTMRIRETIPALEPPAPRAPRLAARTGVERLRPGVRGDRAVRVGDQTVDLRAIEQLVEPGQVRAIARLMARMARRTTGESSLADLLRETDAWLDESGLDALDAPVAYDLSRPRAFELAAALNRWRALRFERAAG